MGNFEGEGFRTEDCREGTKGRGFYQREMKFREVP